MHSLKDLMLITESFLRENSQKSILSLKPFFEEYNGDDWQNYVKFSSDCYSRNHVIHTKEYELLILCWQPNQGSPIHNHPKQGCLLKVLEGELSEKKYNKSNYIVETIYKTGEVSYIDNQLGVHQIKNQNQEKAVSLHLYVPGFFEAKKSNELKDFY